MGYGAKLALSGTALALALSGCASTPGSTPSPSLTRNAWAAPIADAMLTSCRESVRKAGISDELVNAGCACSLKGLQDRYSQEQMTSGGLSDDIAQQVGQECARDLNAFPGQPQIVPIPENTSSQVSTPPTAPTPAPQKSEVRASRDVLKMKVAQMSSSERGDFCRLVTNTPTQVSDEIQEWTGNSLMRALEEAYETCSAWGL